MKYFATFKDGKVSCKWKRENDKVGEIPNDVKEKDIVELPDKLHYDNFFRVRLINKEIVFDQTSYDEKEAKKAKRVKIVKWLKDNKNKNLSVPELNEALKNIIAYLGL